MSWIVRYGEIGIKGKAVRKEFEKVLLNNLKATIGDSDIFLNKGRISIKTENDLSEQLSHVFGIVSFSEAEEFEISTIEDIKPKLDLDFSGSFAVKVKRAGFPGKSIEIAGELGHYIGENTKAKVDLSNPDKLFEIEIRNRTCFIIKKTLQGLGGLPVGTSGRIYSALNDEDDVQAALMMMKRGCTIATDGDKSLIEKYHKGQEINEDGWVARVSTDNIEDIKKSKELVFWPLIGN